MTEEEQRFIQEHMTDDVTALLLNPPKQFKTNIKFLAEQIRSRQKAKGKIPSWLANPLLTFPSSLSVEQSSSDITADCKANLVNGNELIDLSGGMGVDCMRMSDNFRSTTYLEQNQTLAEIFDSNQKLLDKSITVKNLNSADFIESLRPIQGRVIFVDPDRRNASKKLVEFSDCSPDIVELQPKLEHLCDQLLIKASPLLDIKSGLKQLNNVKEVHVVSVRNECKEVLFLVDFKNTQEGPVHIRTINFGLNAQEIFEFNFDQEEESDLKVGPLKQILLIPNSSVLKAGAFKTLTDRFEITKLSANTHLYTAQKTISNFPGRQFKIIATKVSKGILKDTFPDNRVNIISRNHPLSPNDILKKFKLKEGGNDYLIAFRDWQNKAQIVLANKF